MLLMIFSRPLTHCFASPSLAAIRSRFFLRPLKMMEKHWSSSLLWRSGWDQRLSGLLAAAATRIAGISKRPGGRLRANLDQLPADQQELQIWISLQTCRDPTTDSQRLFMSLRRTMQAKQLDSFTTAPASDKKIACDAIFNYPHPHPYPYPYPYELPY
ncbi:hypothetical protein EYF80_001493 [Liparis tanakae]|uniref:Uncharacterized protein n=1 Tax=Liparis tanakae TaxID=230148 RepID=A0A4Z2JE69_9TELE|nr:hypothetical protein EYF80_001493 [Liparis tanakae]